VARAAGGATAERGSAWSAAAIVREGADRDEDEPGGEHRTGFGPPEDLLPALAKLVRNAAPCRPWTSASSTASSETTSPRRPVWPPSSRASSRRRRSPWSSPVAAPSRCRWTGRRSSASSPWGASPPIARSPVCSVDRSAATSPAPDPCRAGRTGPAREPRRGLRDPGGAGGRRAPRPARDPRAEPTSRPAHRVRAGRRVRAVGPAAPRPTTAGLLAQPSPGGGRCLSGRPDRGLARALDGDRGAGRGATPAAGPRMVVAGQAGRGPARRARDRLSRPPRPRTRRLFGPRGRDRTQDPRGVAQVLSIVGRRRGVRPRFHLAHLARPAPAPAVPSR
jgi:hypothetical protein